MSLTFLPLRRCVAVFPSLLLLALLVQPVGLAYGQFSGAMSPWLTTQSVNLQLTPTEGVPEGLIYLDSRYNEIFWVDMSQGVMYDLAQIQPGVFKQARVIPVSIGKHGTGKELEGDLKTPIGVYRLTTFLTDERLEDKYGLGAFPLNYPNIWDRLAGRTGSGIWLHGLPKGVDQRPRLDSDGCVVIDNVTLTELKKSIQIGESLIVLAQDMHWLAPDATQAEQGVMKAIEQWRLDWQSLDSKAYLSHYAAEFTDGERKLPAWKAYKRHVNQYKTKIDVELARQSVVAYPGEPDLVMTRFYQIYKSSNFNWEGWKYIYWKKNASGEWKIVYEGNG